MRIALCSDEVYPVHELVERDLAARGHEVVRFGALRTRGETPWALSAEEAALAVAASVHRAARMPPTLLALIEMPVPDQQKKMPSSQRPCATASAARRYNHANALCLSNRLLSGDVAKEIIDAWFEPFPRELGALGVADLLAVEARHLGAPPEPAP